MEVDKALSSLGYLSKWQLYKFSVVCWAKMVACWATLSIVFIGGSPDHHCALSEGQLLNESIPLVNIHNQWKPSQCLKYDNTSFPNVTVACDMGWYYEPEYDETIVTEWDLVCSKDYYSELSQSIFTAGIMMGSVLCTLFADRFGRKPIFVGCQIAALVLGVAIALSPNYIVFVVLRSFYGIFREGIVITGTVLACELFPASDRTFGGIGMEFFWAGAYMLLALLAFLIRHWRYLQLATTLLYAWTISLIWILPESIPWLAANGRAGEAEKILDAACRFNGMKRESPIRIRCMGESLSETNALNSDDCNSNSEGSEEELAPRKTRFSQLNIFKSRTMIVNTFVICSLWFTSCFVYYGLSLGTSSLVGDKYLNFFLSGFVEVPAYILTFFVSRRFGRRYPMICFYIMSAISLLLVALIPASTENGRSLEPLLITMTMIGKFAMTSAFAIVVLVSPEMFPTNLRSFGYGFGAFCGRIGALVAPFAPYIGKYVNWAPSAAYSVAAVVAALLVFILPETLHRPLPDTIEEIESWNNKPSTK